MNLIHSYHYRNDKEWSLWECRLEGLPGTVSFGVHLKENPLSANLQMRMGVGWWWLDRMFPESSENLWRWAPLEGVSNFSEALAMVIIKLRMEGF